uniref:PX domain-containing protein n=1 Tax=Steinernema glaseri TaxID=37863 RepID=A0A1I7Y4A0_9BILA
MYSITVQDFLKALSKLRANIDTVWVYKVVPSVPMVSAPASSADLSRITVEQKAYSRNYFIEVLDIVSFDIFDFIHFVDEKLDKFLNHASAPTCKPTKGSISRPILADTLC